jgi:hypothetical protein
METTWSLIESLVTNSKEYTEQRIELIKLKAIDKSAKVFSKVITALILLLIMVMFFIILNIGVGLLLGDLFGKAYIGFLVLAAFYLIVGVILYLGKDKLFATSLANKLIKKLL